MSFLEDIRYIRDYHNKGTLSISLVVLNAVKGKGFQSSFVSQPPLSPGDDTSTSSAKKSLSFQDFLFRQIDYMMTVESRDVPAEGRRGTHVEVTF